MHLGYDIEDTLDKISKYITKTDCPIKDPSELLSEFGKVLTGKKYQSVDMEMYKNFYDWYKKNILNL